MWAFKKLLYRTWHVLTWFAIRILRFPNPELITGAGSVKQLAKKVAARKVNKALIVTDKPLMALGLLDDLFESLKQERIDYVVFDGVEPNPSIENVELGRSMYKENNCDGIIVFGGGSPIDCAKGIGARISNPYFSIHTMSGLFKVWLPLPPFFCVPTTAGTGSETTIAAVITDTQTHQKLIITDLSIVPDVAVLDPELMLGLPSHITAATGMDALTHAVESYLSLVSTASTRKDSQQATRLIFDNLEKVYQTGSDIDARNNMALASFYAGRAFTRAYIGYVHAIAHNMGGLYGVPHGLANAIILPYVLEFYRETSEEKLAQLAECAGLNSDNASNEVLTGRFIDAIKQMNARMKIPTYIEQLKAQDIDLIVQRALKEAHPEYPVPKLMTAQECRQLVAQLVKPS